MRHFFVGLALLAAVAVPSVLVVTAVPTGCAALQPVVSSLPTALAYIQDAQLILTGLEQFYQAYFAAKPNPDLQTKVVKADVEARAALDAALRVVTAAQELDQQKIDEAFADFRTAYIDLVGILGPLGVRRAAPSARMGASDTGFLVPDPLVINKR